MEKLVKCRYSHCQCDKRELTKDEAIKQGNTYYHPQCHKEMQNINSIRNIFMKQINPNASISQLNSVINNIIFKKHISSEYLLNGLQFYISKKIPLNYPQGLYYVIQNKDFKSEWDKKQSSLFKEQINQKINNIENINGEYLFGYVPKKQKTIIDVLEE